MYNSLENQIIDWSGDYLIIFDLSLSIPVFKIKFLICIFKCLQLQ